MTLKNKKNLDIFGRYFFPHLIQGTDPVPECHLSLIEEMTKRTNSAIIFPRNHAKSTWEKIDTIHDVVYALEPVILYVGKTLRDGQSHFDSIKHELETNELLRAVYGNLVPEASELEHKWTNVHIETRNGINIVARGACKGRGVNIKGNRPSKIILDDIEDDQEIKSAEQRQKLHNWVQAVIMPSRDRRRGFVKMIGTVLHPKSELIYFFETYGGIKRKAIENGKPIWWSMEELEREKRNMGSLLFRQEYLNEPITESERLIKESWLKIKPPPPYKLRQGTEETILADMYGAIDPAISEKETADYTATCTVGRFRDTGRIIVYDVSRDHLPFPEQPRLVMRKHQNWRYTVFGVEAVAYQKALKQELDRMGSKENVYVPTRELIPDKDKVRRLQGILPHIENGTIEFSDQLPPEFFEELLSFPNGSHDDMVDAFVNAVTLAIEGGESLDIILL